MGAPAVLPPMTEPARRFQHYEVLTRADGHAWELGRGAMGITYKAFDVNLCCEVALKVVNSALLNHPGARERFVREARSAAALRHRNVASVYHLGNDGEHFFYAMEYIDGETLDTLVRRRGPMPVATVLDVLLQVAKALVAAERQQLVHRDLKPSNLMAVHEDGDEAMTIKVIDFGLARTAAGVEGAAQVTMGGFVGTPQYASPEQLEERPLDARSDIYSLGVTGWYLLTSAPPFSGSLAAVCQQQINQPPPWDKLAQAVPEGVRRLLGHLLAKDPAERPQNARELRTEVEQVLESLPETARDVAWETALPPRDGLPLRKRLGERYLVECLLEEQPGTKVYLARDEARDDESVVIRTLPALAAVGSDALESLRQEVRLVQAAAHPGLTEIYALQAGEGSGPPYLVEEALAGFSLRDLLAAHDGALALGDTLRLVEQAATALDHAARCRLEHLDLSIGHLCVHFPFADPHLDAHDSTAVLRTLPMDRWPTWGVKIHPLSTHRSATEHHTWAGDLTLLPGMEHGSGGAQAASASYLKALAAVTCELLGGSRGTAAGTGPARLPATALPSLNEAGNNVLRDALAIRPRYTTCQEFYAALVDAASAAKPYPARATVTGTSLFPPKPAINPVAAQTVGEETSAWDRLQIGRQPTVHPGRWFLVIGAVVGVFLCAFGAVLALLLHGGTRSNQPARARTAERKTLPSPFPATTVPVTPVRVAAQPSVAPSPFAAPLVKVVPVATPSAEPTSTPRVDESPPEAAVHFFSKPRGAEVRWHGRLLGVTPTTAQLPPGEQELVVRYPDGPETHQTVVVRGDQEGTDVEIQPMRTDLLPLNVPPSRREENGGGNRLPPNQPRIATPPPRRTATPVRRPLPLEPFTQGGDQPSASGPRDNR